MATFKTRDKQTVTDGETVELVLLHGGRPDIEHGFYERTLRGVVRSFRTEARYDPETGKQTQASETRWEIETGDPQYPAIGFVPENVLTRSGQ